MFPYLTIGFLLLTTSCIADYENTAEYWTDIGQNILRKQLTTEVGQENTDHEKPRNVVLVIGSGMSITSLNAAGSIQQHRYGKTLYFDNFSILGFARTHCSEVRAARNECVGSVFSKIVEHNDSKHHVESLAQWALSSGKDVGIVTNGKLTFESITPMYSQRSKNETEDDDISDCRDMACQLLLGDIGKQFKVILGGGKRSFVPESVESFPGQQGERKDNRNLIREWIDDKTEKKSKYIYAESKFDLVRVKNDTQYLLGMFASDEMNFTTTANHLLQPTMEEMVRVATNVLSKNENGYFLFVYDSKIDYAHRMNWAKMAVVETEELARAVQAIDDLTNDKDTLLIVTADHGSTMTISGYPGHEGYMFGSTPGFTTKDINRSVSILTYGNGPGFRMTTDGSDITYDPYFQFIASAPMTKGTYGGEDVIVFAKGPWQELFVGSYNLDVIPDIVGYAACMGPGVHSCKSSAIDSFMHLNLYLYVSLVFVSFNIL